MLRFRPRRALFRHPPERPPRVFRQAAPGGSAQTAAQVALLKSRRLRATLEVEHAGRYVAVEPVSGDHFVADTLDAAADAAQAAHPARRSHVLRVGYAAALHIGGAWS